jgi:nitrogen PTS system EIIA component
MRLWPDVTLKSVENTLKRQAKQAAHGPLFTAFRRLSNTSNMMRFRCVAAMQHAVHNARLLPCTHPASEGDGSTVRSLASYNSTPWPVPKRNPALTAKAAVWNALAMNRLATILPPSNVLVDVDATSKKRAFEQAGLVFENQHAIARATVTDNLFARERLGSTGLGHGVAIPHGRIKGLKNPLAAVVRVQQPIPFDAPDEEPVSLLIFLLVPEAATQRHLEILSEIAEMLSDRELRERLKVEGDAAKVHELISNWEPLKSVA